MGEVNSVYLGILQATHSNSYGETHLYPVCIQIWLSLKGVRAGEATRHQNSSPLSFVLGRFQEVSLKLSLLKLKNMQQNPFLDEILLTPLPTLPDTS